MDCSYTAYYRTAHNPGPAVSCGLCNSHQVQLQQGEKQRNYWVVCTPDSSDPHPSCTRPIHIECAIRQLRNCLRNNLDLTCPLCKKQIIKLNGKWLGSPYTNVCYAATQSPDELEDFLKNYPSFACETKEEYLGRSIQYAASIKNPIYIKRLLEHAEKQKNCPSIQLHISEAVRAAISKNHVLCLSALLDSLLVTKILIPKETIQDWETLSDNSRNSQEILRVIREYKRAKTPVLAQQTHPLHTTKTVYTKRAAPRPDICHKACQFLAYTSAAAILAFSVLYFQNIQ